MQATLGEYWERLIMHPWLLGDASLEGRVIAKRVRVMTIGAVVLANAVGAAVVLTFSFWALPKGTKLISHRTDLVNLLGATVYLLLAIGVGVRWGRHRLEQGPHGIAGWLEQEREPNEQERALVLRAPLRIMEAQAALWVLAVVLFSALNATFSWQLALGVGLTVALGGITTTAAAYLLVEISIRPVLSRAFAYKAPRRLPLQGVAARWLLTWALGTGVPIVGLLLVAIVALTPIEIKRSELLTTTIALCTIGLVFGAVVSLLGAYLTVHPIGAIRRALARVQRGELGVELQVWDTTEVGMLQAGFNEMVEGLRERERIRDMFGRQVGEAVVREALSAEVHLGGERRRVGVLFVDLVGSTELAAGHQPEVVVSLLNRFFAEVIEVIGEHGGWIDKFAGDGALAVFGAPVALADCAGSALAAARSLALRLQERLPELRAGIGVSAGEVVAGNIGSEQRFQYTVIGDPVNEAARLTDLAKHAPSGVLASGAALAQCAEQEAERWVSGDDQLLRGRKSPTLLAWPVGTEGRSAAA